MGSSDLGQMVVRIVGDNSGLDTSIDNSQKKMKTFEGMSLGMAAGIGAAASAAVIGLVSVAVRSTAQMEMLQASFETMLGSAEKATVMMDDLKKMAAVTPFETTDLAQASKTLLQFGVESGKIIPTLKMLGDASGGSAAKFSSMALVFGQVSSLGRLQGGDLLQLINAGFNPLNEIAKKTGQSMAELKDQMSKGGISAQMVTEAFQSATGAGGKFYNGMDTASKTLEGIISTLKDDVATLGRSFVQDLMPFIKQVVLSLSAFAQKLAALSPETKQVILTIAELVVSIGTAIGIIYGIEKAIGVFKLAMVSLSTTGGPILAAIAAIGLLIAVIMRVVDEKNRKDLDDVAKRFKNISEAIGVSAETLQKLEGAFKNKFGSNEWLLNLGKSKDITDWTVQSTMDWTKELGITTEQYFKIALASSEVTETQKASLLVLEKQVIEQKKLYETYQLMIDKKADNERRAQVELARIRQEKLDFEKTELELIRTTLDKNKAEKDLIQTQIDGLNKLKGLTWNDEKNRLEAIKILQTKKQLMLDEEVKARKDAESAKQKVINDAMDKEYGDWVSARDKMEKTQDEYEIRELLAQENTYNEKLNFANDEANELISLDEWVYQNKLKLYNKEKEDAEKLKEDLISLAQETYSTIGNLVGVFQSNDIKNQKETLAEELRLNDEALQAALVGAEVQDETAVESAQTKLNAAVEANDAEAISEAQKALTKAQIEQDYTDKKLAIEKQGRQDAYQLELKAFQTQQAFAIGQIAISTAIAVAKVWEQTGIAGLVAQLAPIGMGALQAAAIWAQRPPSAPTFADGGIIMPKVGGTMGVLAEAGQPEVVFPLDQLNKFLGGNNTKSGNFSGNENMHLVVNLDARPILDKIFEATRNRTVLISQGAVV